jgi:anti-sigma factor RsiW
MKHKQFEDWLQLSLYDELSEQERGFLENHLEMCAQCRSDLHELNALHKTLAHRRLAVAQETFLQEARRDLRLRIHADGKHRSFWKTLKSAVDEFLDPQIQAALGGFAILVIGILIGYYILASSSERIPLQLQTTGMSSAMEAGESQISNLRFLDRDGQTGNVEFTFETITPVRIRGNVNDDDVQKVLARALVSNQSVGTRLRAVSMIGTQTDPKQQRVSGLDAEVESALISALLHDKNLGVRREALSVLRNYLPDPVIVRAFLEVLEKENNTGLKIAAINSLDLSKYENQPVNREILEMFKHTAQSDNNNYIRIKAKAALQEIQQ